MNTGRQVYYLSQLKILDWESPLVDIGVIIGPNIANVCNPAQICTISKNFTTIH